MNIESKLGNFIPKICWDKIPQKKKGMFFMPFFLPFFMRLFEYTQATLASFFTGSIPQIHNATYLPFQGMAGRVLIQNRQTND